MRARTAAWLALAFVLPAQARAQAGPEEQARRLLDEGRAYIAQGKVKQALDDFSTIVSGYSGTSSVDDALLEIGRYHADTEGDLAKARDSFEQVTKRFPQSDGAPGAYYQLGMLTLRGSATPAELDDALAQFTRVVRLYGQSRWVPDALYATGLVLRRQGKLNEAAESERRVALEYPSSEIAAEAQFQLGQMLALLGDHASAMEEFQRVRNRWPQSPFAEPARERITALYRLFAGSRPSFTADPAWSVGAGDVLKDVRALLVDRTHNLWIASDKVNGVVPFSAEGKMGPSLAGNDLRSLSLAADGQVVVASRLAVRIGPKDIRSFSIPGDKPGVTEPLEHLTSAVVLPGGHVLVADDNKKKVFRFDAKSQYVGVFGDARPRQVVRMVLDPDNAVVMLDREAKTVTVFDRAGALLRTIGPTGAGFLLKKPSDVAVDAFRNIYVTDEEGGIYVLSPTGQYLATLGGEEARKPRAVTIDASGAVIVYDDKTEKMVRYR